MAVDQAGNPVFLEGTIEDITGRKRAEKQKEEAAEALRLSEARYRLVAENSDDLIFTLDTDLCFTYISPASMKLLGKPAEEAVRESISEIMTPESFAGIMAEYIRVLPEIEQGKNPTLRMEIEEYRKDGSTVWVEVNIRTMRDNAGRLTGYVGISRDVSERRRMEQQKEEAIEALRRSEERYRLVAENSGDVIITLDTNYHVTYVSPAVFKLRGMTPEEVDGQSLDQIMTPASLEAAYADYSRVLPEIEKGNNPTSHLEVELYRKDGSTVWVEISLTTMRDDTGRLIGYVGVYHDISARRRAEEELKLRNILLSTQQEVSIDGILVVDENGAMISFNRRFGEIWNIPGDVLESKSDERALQSVLGNLADPDEFIAKVRRLYENRTETSHDEISLKDGRTLDRYSAPMLGNDGRYYGRIWYFRDITKRKRSEEALRESERRLADIINFLPIATFVINQAGVVTAWNRALEEITGVKAADMIGKGNYEYALPFYGERRSILVDRGLFLRRRNGDRVQSDPSGRRHPLRGVIHTEAGEKRDYPPGLRERSVRLGRESHGRHRIHARHHRYQTGGSGFKDGGGEVPDHPGNDGQRLL